MLTLRQFFLVVVLLIVAGIGGYGVYRWLSPNQTPNSEGVNVPAPKPEVPMTPADTLSTRLEGLAGGSAHKLSDWHGKAVLVNFWATWCGPCREEIPELVHLQAKYGGAGLQVVGIATDEPEVGPVNDYLKRMVVNYPMLMGDERVGRLVAGLGGNLVGLPYTVVLDRNGHTLKIHAGELHSDDAEKLAEEALATVATPAPGAPTAAAAPTASK